VVAGPFSTFARVEKVSTGPDRENDVDSRVSRPNGISYLRIPARDVRQSAEFYRAVFAWKVSSDPDHPSFEDGSGHVIGHWIKDLQVVGEAGVVPYIYVDRIKETLEKIQSNGGDVVRAPYPEGELWVATFRDPAGNVLGIWQSGPL
jgi:predicted enzyme related to lactoylglutathione lyase